MKRSGKMLLLMGVLLALTGGGALFMYLQSLGQASAKAPPPVNIVVAAADIPSFKPITPELVRLKSLPPDAVTQDNVRDISAIVGKALKAPAKAGQQMFTSGLTEQSFSYSVPKGKRAQAIFVDRLSVFNGLLREGDHVDVVFMGVFPQINRSEGENGKESDPQETAPTGKVVVQNAQVVKVQNPTESDAAGTVIIPKDLEMTEGADNATGLWTVVLAVSDQEAEIVRYSQAFGTASLVLRANGDTGVEKTTGVSQEILDNNTGVPVPVQPAK